MEFTVSHFLFSPFLLKSCVYLSRRFWVCGETDTNRALPIRKGQGRSRYAVGQPLRMGRVRFRLNIRKPTDAIEEQDLRKGNRKRNGKGQKGVPLGEPLEKGDFSSFLFLKVSLSLLLISTFLKHFQKSTQKYTRPVLNYKIEKEPEQELILFRISLPQKMKKSQKTAQKCSKPVLICKIEKEPEQG